MQQRRRDHAAFSLIELLCVIALITAVSAWVLVNTTQLGSNFTLLSYEEVFRKAVKEARHLARTHNSWIDLRWDDTGQKFVFENRERSFEVSPETIGQDRLRAQSPIRVSLFIELAHSGFEKSPPIEQAVSKLRFYPSGFSSRARVRWKNSDLSKQPLHELSLDAFSSGPIPQKSANI
jgi:prepilin-type N-terminal cleavage/methylation domain-containing protein